LPIALFVVLSTASADFVVTSAASKVVGVVSTINGSAFDVAEGPFEPPPAL
jgi:hypothetical protein